MNPVSGVSNFKTHEWVEIRSWSRSYFSKEMVLISLYIKRSNKGGAFIAPRRVIKFVFSEIQFTEFMLA